jgi:hypothetical protein
VQWKVLTKIETLEKEIIWYRIVGERTGGVCGGERKESRVLTTVQNTAMSDYEVYRCGGGYWEELRATEARFLLLLTRSDRSDPF